MKELRNRNVKSVFGGIGIAMLLCGLMVLMSWSAMVTNSDINSESAIVNDSEDTKIDSIDKIDAETQQTSFEADLFGFDEDREMLGMRTENTKTFLDDQGQQQVVISDKPLHYTNHLGQLIDLDTSIKTWDNGYYVNDIHNPVSFGNHAYEGFTMALDDSEIISGLDVAPVIVMQGASRELQLPGMYGEPVNEVHEIGNEYFTPSTKNIEIGGSSIQYPLAHGMDLVYHVEPTKVKQEMIINELSQELKLHLQSSTEFANEDNHANSMFGLMESMVLPENTELWAGNHQVTALDGVFAYDSMLTIRDSSTGAVVAYIDAPVARDSSSVERIDESTEFSSKPSVQYFIEMTEDGQTLQFITAVSTEWLLDEYTVFPVYIDPSVGSNTEQTLTTGGYNVCVVEDVDCFTRSDGRYEHDYYGSLHEFAPYFDFEFNQGTALSVAQVTAYVTWANRLWTQSGAEFTSIQIMEDCGGSPPDGDEGNLNAFANPSGCTGEPIAQYVPPSGGTSTQSATVYEFRSFTYGTNLQYHYFCRNTYAVYDLTSDMTSCRGYSWDWIGVGGSGTASGPEESNGRFAAGGYDFHIFDTAGDSLDNGAAIHFETRAVGGTGAWTTIKSESGFIGSSGRTGTITVPAGDEMRIAYHCPYTYNSCYADENYMTLTPALAAPSIPGAAVGVGGAAPTGSEPADVTFSVAQGEEAYMSFTSGNAVGDAGETVIYYRAAGTTGWSDSWDICTGTACAPVTTYDSYLATPSIIFQIPGTYELLVWDTTGDGSGTGAGGIMVYATAGQTTGTIQNSPSGLRLVSLVSSEQIATFQINSGSATNRGVQLCTSMTDCNTGAMAMFVDAYKNTGYLEFTLGFPSGANNPAWSGARNMDGGAYFNNFYLVVELEDNTPDATPPTVEYDAHYTGVTSYVEGERTLFLSLMDSNNPIDTTTANGPKLHYSTDGGNTYSVANAESTNTCNSKNIVCGFAATTSDLAAGTTVDYYWTYSDAAAYDTTKVPTQTPNPGRFPAAGASDLTFTVADIYSAPTDGTDMKLVTYMDNIRSAEPHTSVSSGTYAADVDRQMTYYTSSGEFVFEFGLDRCGAAAQALGASNGGVYSVPGTDGQGNCFFDYSAFGGGSFGEDSGHWDINWEGVASDCSPGMTGCTGAPANNLELAAHFGGPLGITGLNGAGNLIFVYDSANNAWMISGAGSGIANTLDSSLPDVVSMATYTSNIFTPTGPQPTRSMITSGMSGAGGLAGTITIASGDVGRIGYYDGGCCNSEQGVTVEDTSNGLVYNLGRTYYASWRAQYQVPGQYVSSGCTSYSCSFAGGGTSGGNYYWSNSLSSVVNNNLPNNGVLSAGTYNIYFWDTYGDSTDGNRLYLETIAASTGFSSTPAGPFETNEFSTRSSSTAQGQSFVIDLSGLSTNLGSNTGFGGVPIGTGNGEFNMVCVTTAGHVMFMESTTPRCTPDSTITAAGGQWQGFALGAGKTNFQYNGNGMLYQIRDVAPDPDTSAPTISGAEIGDSHALDRTLTVTLSDNGAYDTGLDVSPVPGVGPTAYVTITSADGSTSSSQIALQPSGDRNECAVDSCEWTGDINNLVRGDTVTYYITASDTYPPGANTLTTASYSFNVANPTNTLVVEWHEYAYNTATSQPCSMQVIMYDVTNEFEFHYDDDCYVDDIVGLVGIRETNSNVLQVRNDPTNRYGTSTYSPNLEPGNPHTNNIRFTLTDSGEYTYEYFDLGMSFLPLASSDQTIPVRSTTFSNDNNCDSNADFANYGLYCAGNFDIPDDFNFDFYGQNFDGADSNNRIHVTGSGVMYFIDNGDTNTYRHEGSWNTNGAMYDLTTTSTLYPDMMMSPWWSRETMDYCYSSGSRTCEGVWYRTLPFDGQGKTVSADITDDTTWYLVDSPIKVNPADASGYLSVMADLTIEPGVEVIMAENTGISFDGGLQADGTCAQFTAVGSGSDRITFNADRSTNSNAQWHGLAFTDDCGGTTTEDRHMFDMVDFSNTNHAAITAGSRPADPNGPSCGTANQDCDIGEFTMNDVTFTNVASAFAHGSGQGTVVTMSNFAVTDARDSCFNFAENTVATLTGTASNPSTMTRCNTNNNYWGGAVVGVSGSTAGSLTMSYIDIHDSLVTLIRTDLQMVTISDVTATMTNGQNNYRWTDNGNSGTLYDTTGVSLGLSHGSASEVVVSNFDAQNYAQGYICAASKISLTNVNLGTGFHNNHRFDIDPYCGAVTSTVGTVGANSVFDGVTVANMQMFRTFPGTANDITVANDFRASEFTASGSPSDPVEFTNMDVGGLFESRACNAMIKLTDSEVGRINAICSSGLTRGNLEVLNSNINHGTNTNSAVYLYQTSTTIVDVTVTSSSISATGPKVVYADQGANTFLIDVDLADGNGNVIPCADQNGKTAGCHTTAYYNQWIGSWNPYIYYGGFANALAYRLGQDSSTTPPTPTQIPESGVTVTASTLDGSGNELLPGKVIYKDLTGADGRAARVAVITGNHDGVVYDSHIVRASGAAGAGEAHPDLADGTAATLVEFEDGVLQTSVPLANFDTYTIGSYADIRLTSPPVTLDDAGMNCAWMATNDTFSGVQTPGTTEFVFKQAELVLAGDMAIDGCTVELMGTKLIFREDSVNNPTLTISNGGSLIMTVDADTGDMPKVFGEGNLDAVDIVIASGGTLDMQGGTMKNFLLGAGKTGQLEVLDGGALNLGTSAFLTSSDLSAAGATNYPMIYADGGVVTVSSAATLAGANNLGIGVALTNGGELNGDGLTVSNMLTGVDSDGGSLNLDSYTSNGNTNGVIAKDGPKLPQVFSSATMQGITQNYPTFNFGSYYGQIPGMDNCYLYHMYACFEWEEYTVDLTSWVGQSDYLQPSMMLNYGGMGAPYWSGWSSGHYPYIAMDNLYVTITDNAGNEYIVDSSDDVGYYPYGADDPEVVNNGATYLGGQGGVPNWDCNAIATTFNPWRYGTNMYYNYYYFSFSPSVGNLYGMTSNGYPDEFGFRLGIGDTPELIGVSSRPLFSWGYDDPFLGRYGPANSYLTNPGTYKDTTIGSTGTSNYETCLARGASYMTNGMNMLLEWPTLDLTDSSIAKVELKFDMWHRYHGSYANFYGNNFPDNVEILARSGADPSQFGEYSEEIIGKGVTLTNSDIVDATVGVDILGNTITVLNNVAIQDPDAFAVRTAGNNNVYIDGLDVDDASAGANTNYGFYTESTSTGIQQISNSDFNGLGTAVYLTNDVDTTISDTVIANGPVGLRVGSQSSANHDFSRVTLSNNGIGLKADGTGALSMTDVNINSVTTDIEITDSSKVSFLDGTLDEAKLVFGTGSIGSVDRDRTYSAEISADGTPIDGANVVLSSRDAASSSSGSTDSNGITSGLSFSVYDYDATGKTDYSALFSTYTISTVAMVSYSYTDETTNDADFRYIQTSPTLVDDASDTTSVNFDQLSLVDPITARVCATNSDYVVVAPCAGGSLSTSRTYSNGMVEYGDIEAFQDGTSTLDLSGEAIMIDTGSLELKDGVNYIFDNAIIFDTGYTTEYGTGITEWKLDVPYGTTITMNGGEINGLYPKTETGDVVGLIIGGLKGGDNEGALNLDIDGVTLNNVVGFATGTGDRTYSSLTGSYTTYLPSTVSIENSFINHFRGYFFYPTLYSDADYCIRLSGVTSASIASNTFSDCTVGVTFFDSEWNSAGTTTVNHEQIGSDNVVIDGNTFVGASGFNVLAWPDSDADLTTISNNVMTCNTCMHVRYMDDSSVSPIITGNTFNGGTYGVYSDETESISIDQNTFNNQENYAIRVQDGDFDATGNAINNPGEYAIYADSLEKPSEVIESIVAGVNSPQPDDGISYITWTGSCGGYGYGVGTGSTIPCTSPDVEYTLNAGDEMIIRLHEGGSYISELTVNYKDPSGTLGSWDPNVEGDESWEDGSPNPLIFSAPGTYFFNLEDDWGDGANGGGFEVVKAAAGAWSAAGNANTNPVQFWDPGVTGLVSVEPGYRGPYNGYPTNPPSSTPTAYSNTMDAVLVQNNGADAIDYELIGIDQYGDGWHGNYIRAQVAPVGTWATDTTGYPPVAGYTGGGTGTTIGGIGGSSTSAFPWVTMSGRYSAPLIVTLDAGYEMRFSLTRAGSWAGEIALSLQEVMAPDNSWTGPSISGNTITFDSANNNPNAVGLALFNCDVNDYSITTKSNVINIGQNAVLNEGCIWNDVNSQLIGSDQSGSVGYDDSTQAFGFDISLDGTQISGFETGIMKSGGGLLTLTGDAIITAGVGGVGVEAVGIEVSAIGATVDGGDTGVGMHIEDSQYGWFYPMDVSGYVGIHAINSEILWDVGSTDASTAIRTENVRGTIQSITDNSVSSGTTAIVDLAWEADYALTSNQNRPHDVNQDGANDFERFDKIGNTGYNLRLDLDDNTQRTYAVVPYTGTVDLDATVNSNDDRPYEVSHSLSDKLVYVSYGPLGTPSSFVFAYQNNHIYYYNHGSGSGAGSSNGGIQIDAQSDSRLTVIDFPLDETRMLVDGTSIVEEANWLSIDANHLGAEPADAVGLSIISDSDHTAYSSPVFEGTMQIDGDSSDWVGGNALNPSGYAMPGSVGGPMYLTVDSGDVVFGFDAVSTATSDVYIYVDSNDMAGTTTGFNGVHTLPYAADFAVVVDSSGADVYYYNDPAWVLNPTANAVNAEGAYLEVAVPATSLGGSSVNSMNIVATVQAIGTDTVTAVSPSQSTVGTGAETLTAAYDLELNKLDMADGVIENEVLMHRAFEFSSTPTAPHTYSVMVKTAAEARHTCDYDWATQTGVTMEQTKSLTFDILRACPEITTELGDIVVLEDSTAITLDLATYVDDEQDVEADMVWDVTGDNMDAYANILSDFEDLSGVTGTYDVTPINDQFGTFELTFEVVDSHGQTASKTILYTVLNVNDAPVICDARTDVDPDCDNGDVYLYADAAGDRFNSRDEGFTSYSKPLGKVANDTINSFIRDMANEQDPVNQVYTWGASADCDQISVSLQQNAALVSEIVIVENQEWQEGGICAITLTLSDDGNENTDADPVTVYFEVAPVNDAPVIASEGTVTSADGSNSFQGVPDGSYRLDLVEDTTNSGALTFDLSGIKSDIDHVDADLAWTLTDTNTCNSANYYSHSINGDTLEFTLIPDATTNAEPWEVDMLNNNGIHQTRTANGRCEMTLTLLDSPTPNLANYTALTPNNYVQESVSVTLSVEVDNVAENVPDYFLDETEGFDFNRVSNVMPGTMVPVDFSIFAGGDEGPYTYDHLLVVSLHSDGHTEVELPRYYSPPAFGQSLDIQDWDVLITDQTTEVWVEVDVVTCNPGSVCTPDNNNIQTDNPESHNAVSSSQVFGKWSEPGRIGEDANGAQSNRRPAFEDKNWCNNMMSTNGGNEVAWSESASCGHTEQGYNGQFSEDWQTADTALPVVVSTIGALSVASFAPSIIAVALTGLFVSALVLAGRRDDDEEEFVEEQMSDDESAVSPVIATILMVAITVVLSGVVYVWAAQLADTDTKGVPRVTFDATNVDTGDVATDHWKITVGQAQTVLATQAVEVRVIYADATGAIVTDVTNLASTNQVYGFSPFNSDQLVTFGDVVTLDEDETISSFSTGDDIYVKTHLADGTPLVDATIRIVYSPAGDTQGSVIKTYTGMTWNQPV